MEYENLSFVEAIEQLAERANVTLPEKSSGVNKGEEDLRYKLLEINKNAALFFVKQLRSSKGKHNPLRSWLCGTGKGCFVSAL